jgi:hypothetical protein
MKKKVHQWEEFFGNGVASQVFNYIFISIYIIILIIISIEITIKIIIKKGEYFYEKGINYLNVYDFFIIIIDIIFDFFILILTPNFGKSVIIKIKKKD